MSDLDKRLADIMNVYSTSVSHENCLDFWETDERIAEIKQVFADKEKHEFNRGWDGGTKEGIRTAIKLLTRGKQSEISEDSQKDIVLLKIPRENMTVLHDALEKESEYI